MFLAAVTAKYIRNDTKYKFACYHLNPPRLEGIWRSGGRAAGILNLGVRCQTDAPAALLPVKEPTEYESCLAPQSVSTVWVREFYFSSR